MFSHEVKNYALLTYEGELVVRGVALRSSRAEAFGERFLHAALRCLLQGDVVGIRDTFLATVAALRARELPLRDVATRVRLTKSPERYQRTRTKHREFAYEALLEAGRKEWRVGERVYCYRAAAGRAIWLPDEAEGAEAELPGYDIEHYVKLLHGSYAARLRKAFAPPDFERLFRVDAQLGLFDPPLAQIEPRWVRCPAISASTS
jgi:DNA polymerase elongation subunit (family B)